MPNFNQNHSHVNAVAFIDYKPAELRINSQWLIVYYAKHPVKKEFERFRVTVPVMESRANRLKYAKTIVLEINKKLQAGWLPYYSSSGTSEFKTFKYCSEKFLDQIREEIKKGNKRPDTLRAYTSYLSMIDKYVTEKELALNLVLDFNKAYIVNYLDWIYYDRQNSPRTYNNHLAFIGNFLNFCISRDYLKENHTLSIPRKDEKEKIRQILTDNEKAKLKAFGEINPGYFRLCMATYFCFIRRTELTKLKVSAVNLKQSYILIAAEISKNKKEESVTIPDAYMPLLIEHLKTAKNDDYLFSTDDFKPGKQQLERKKISDTWVKFRKLFEISVVFQFYSLKDTGITDLLNAGVPAIKVRDQARHYDLKITEKYTARNRTCDDVVKNSNFNF